MSSTWFITGTDTGIGKTWCTLALMRYQQQQKGLKVAAMKPVATGSLPTPQGLRNEDAMWLRRASSVEVPYEIISPYTFAQPVSPNIAAEMSGRRIELPPIIEAYQKLKTQADLVLVEGLGGWRVPLSDQLGLNHLVQALDAGVIMVVGLRLGCINHALLSSEIIQADHCPLVGWIANPIDPEFNADASIATLEKRISAPLLGRMPFMNRPDPAKLAGALNNLPELELAK